MENVNSFTEGGIVKPLIKFSIPLMMALLLQALYGGVDLIIVGQFGNTASVAAVAIGSQIMQAITGIITGLTMGVTVLIAQYMGAKKKEKISDVVAALIKLFSIISIVVTLIMVIFAKQIGFLMKVPAEAFQQTVNYIRICSMGTIFIVAYNAISGIFRGMGNSKLPLLFVFIACIVNIVCDFIFVGVFKLDSSGAALATVLAQAVSVVCSVIFLRKNKSIVNVKKHNFKNNGAYIKQILKIGGPIALQDSLTTVSFLIITSIMNSIGLVASACAGISGKIFIFLAIIPMAFMSALGAIVAQNVGAGKEKRAIAIFKTTTLISMACGVVMFLLTYFKGAMLASIFEKNTEVIKATAEYLKSCSVEYILVSTYFCCLGYFNGIGKTTFVMLQGLASAFLVRIPLSYYLSRIPNVDFFTLGLSVPISALFSVIACFIYFFMIKKKRVKSEKLI
ncbi:putative efflux protein, MATE family [Hathewaya proteolytica DSM 3090]|uniref:Putative efflux protein, MATE family n=1 Tax=Hathewaya proteolytica DSM 3090 TaxID=1121331 RepID=A0A1M6QDP4_9CLOT|nr:MATE family efflux transporter [Hathewaya proteolytica]SHK18316.1 putative efflux protein, MATE family [Hathewaya proteolytica DSM 3090]